MPNCVKIHVSGTSWLLSPVTAVAGSATCSDFIFNPISKFRMRKSKRVTFETCLQWLKGQQIEETNWFSFGEERQWGLLWCLPPPETKPRKKIYVKREKQEREREREEERERERTLMEVGLEGNLRSLKGAERKGEMVLEEEREGRALGMWRPREQFIFKTELCSLPEPQLHHNSYPFLLSLLSFFLHGHTTQGHQGKSLHFKGHICKLLLILAMPRANQPLN